MLAENVQFLKGWFKDTLPGAPIRQLAVLRADGDMYASTMDTLGNLYGKLSIGGYVIIDDYGSFPACKQAVEDFRAQHSIREAIRDIDGSGVFWQRKQPRQPAERKAPTNRSRPRPGLGRSSVCAATDNEDSSFLVFLLSRGGRAGVAIRDAGRTSSFCAGDEVMVLTQSAGDGGPAAYRVVRRPGKRQLCELVGWCDVFLHNNINLRSAWPLLVYRRPWVIINSGSTTRGELEPAEALLRPLWRARGRQRGDGKPHRHRLRDPELL